MALTEGMTTTRTFQVDRDRTIDFMGEECRVYATPSLIRDIEHTCRDFIVENVDAGMDSVGVTVNVTHMAPTLMGMEAEITVTVSKAEGPKVSFDIAARDGLETICKGSHDRFVVDVEKTAQRLAAKAAKAKGE